MATDRQRWNRIAEVGQTQEGKAARAVGRSLRWATDLIVADLRAGGNGSSALEALAVRLPERLVADRLEIAVETATAGYRASALLTDMGRRSRMLRAKDVGLAFNNPELLARMARVRVEEWLTATAKLETRTSIADLSAILRRAWTQAPDASLSPMAHLGVRDIGAIIGEFTSAVAAHSEARAVLMARTTTSWAANDGAMMSYEDAGIGTSEWVASIDEALTCPFCRTLDGQTRPLGALFAGSGDTIEGTDGGKAVSMRVGIDVYHPPLHPHCLCSLAPVL